MNAETKIMAGVSIAMAIAIGGVAYFASSTHRTGGKSVAAATVSDAGQIERDGIPAIGDPAATVSIVVFSDFQCPACAASAPLAEDLVRQNPGKVRLSYRFFPLPQHKYAQSAARAALAAGQQGKFWEMHDTLFARQAEWSTLGSDSEVSQAFDRFAGEMGLDTAQYDKDRASSDAEKAIGIGLADAAALQLQGTPTYYVNGLKVSNPSQLPEAVEAAFKQGE